jgi:hypothetical protein
MASFDPQPEMAEPRAKNRRQEDGDAIFISAQSRRPEGLLLHRRYW